MEKGYDIFISYSRKDYLMDDEKTPAPDKIVSKILNVLDKHNITYWIDREGLYSSSQFAAVIEEQISLAKCFLFVSTQASNASKYTLAEVFTAVEYEKPIIPFRADDSKFGKGIGFHLRPLDHIEYFKTGDEAFVKLVSSINHIKAEQLNKQLVAEYKNLVAEYKMKLRAKSDEMKSLGINPPIDCFAEDDSIQKIKAEYDQKIAKYQDEKSDLEKRVSELTSAITKIQEVAANAQRKMEDKIHALSVKASSHESKSEQLTEELHDKYKEIESLKRDLSETTNNLNKLEQELQAYKDAEAKQKAEEDARKAAEAKAHRKAEEEKKRGIFKVENVEFKMIHVDGGTFTMGATPEMKNSRYCEKPTHQVTLSNYYIGETPVTQALWNAVMDDNPSRFDGINNPVDYVSWDDCKKFIKELNQKTGQKFRMLTEAEWEFAARGGNKSNHTQYSGSNNLDEVAWYKSNSGFKTHPVKTRRPNELGIYDMSGNVSEWCLDLFGVYSSNAQTNPTGPTTGSEDYVLRGGSWCDDAEDCRLSFRYFRSQNDRSILFGFRLALSE